MTTYQIFRNDSLIADNVSAKDLFGYIPAGSRLVSGNTSKTLINSDGIAETVTEIKAVYQIPCKGGQITIIQKP